MLVYWVGGTNTWNNTNGTKWATTSGGAGGAPRPTAADDAIFDANSGGGAVLVNSNTVASINCSGFTGTLTINSGATLTVNGNITANSSGFIDAGGSPQITIGSNCALTSNGGPMTALQIDSSSIVTLADDLVSVGRILINGAGTLNANNHNVKATQLANAVANASILTMGSGTWEFTADDTTSGVNFAGPWDINSSCVITPNTSTLKFTSTSSVNAVSFHGNGKTFNNIWFARGSSTSAINIFDSNTFNNFKDTGTAAHSLVFFHGTTQTFTTFTVSGSAGNVITINSDTTATHALTCAAGIISCDYLNIQHSIASGGASFYAGTHSTNNQGVATAGSGWTFTAPPSNLFFPQRKSNQAINRASTY